MNESHWNKIYQDGPLQEPQSARHEQIAAGVKAQLGAVRGRTLLLGVNPNLSRISHDVTAVDRNPAVVRDRWSGNTPDRRALVADWLNLPFPAASFAACIGDGSANSLPHAAAIRSLYDNVLRVLHAGGRFVCRVYLTPDTGESVADVASAARQGQCPSFLYFRFRLAMAIAAQTRDPGVPVRAIHAAFNAHFADRDAIPDLAGWSRREIDRIDLYQWSPEIYCFPTRQQCVAMIPPGFENIRFVAAGDYPMAERCPLMVMEKA
jgi:SAM-dependent methyltransferase